MPASTGEGNRTEPFLDEPAGKALLLDVASRQQTLSFLTIGFSQVCLFGYFIFALYSSYLTGSSPSPFSFLFVFAAFTFFPTVVAVFLFRCSQLNREWATGKCDLIKVLKGSQTLYKAATLALAGYILLIAIFSLGLIGVIPLAL